MPDYANAFQTLSVGLSFLKSLGFSDPDKSIETSKLLGNSLLMIYTSTSAQRSIRVSYVAAKDNRFAVMSVFVCDNSGESFSLEDWIAAKNISSRLRFSTDQNSKDEHNFLEQFCLELRSTFEGQLRETLVGKLWDSVPIDWKGYR